MKRLLIMLITVPILLIFAGDVEAAPTPAPQPAVSLSVLIKNRLVSHLQWTYAEQQDAEILLGRCSRLDVPGERYACRIWVSPNHGDSKTRIDRYRVVRLAELVEPGTWDFLDGTGYWRLSYKKKVRQYRYEIVWPKPIPQDS